MSRGMEEVQRIYDEQVKKYELDMKTYLWQQNIIKSSADRADSQVRNITEELHTMSSDETETETEAKIDAVFKKFEEDNTQLIREHRESFKRELRRDPVRAEGFLNMIMPEIDKTLRFCQDRLRELISQIKDVIYSMWESLKKMYYKSKKLVTDTIDEVCKTIYKISSTLFN